MSHPMSAQLRVNEIFYSLQGEAASSGAATVFIRLTGCPLRCHYCDTAYAFNHGSLMSLANIEAEVARYPCQYITLTGGEPLAQPLAFPLLNRLANRYRYVSLETSGALCIKNVDPRVHIVLDLKTPGSGEVSKNKWPNLAILAQKDQVKFVITDYADFLWAKKIIQEQLNHFTGLIFLSPCAPILQAKDLANWILQHHLPVRLQIQLHRYLWSDQPGT
jgi:7-carboxy-7-deazaguanine synthase